MTTAFRHCLLSGGNALRERQRVLLEATHSGPVCRIPDANLTGPVAGNQAFCLVAVGDSQANIGKRLIRPLLAAIGFPQFGDLITADRHDPAVACELNRRHTPTVCPPVFHELAVLELIKPNLAVFAGRGKHVGICPPGDRRHRGRVGFDGHVVAAAERLPEKHAPAAVGGGQEHAIGRIGNRLDPVGVFGVLVEKVPGLGGIHPRHPLGATKGHEALIRR